MQYQQWLSFGILKVKKWLKVSNSVALLLYYFGTPKNKGQKELFSTPASSTKNPLIDSGGFLFYGL